MHKTKFIHFVKTEELKDFGCRFCFTTKKDFNDGLDSFTYKITDIDSFYIDVDYPFKVSYTRDLSELPDSVLRQLFNKLTNMKNAGTIDYASQITISNKPTMLWGEKYLGENIEVTNCFINHRYWHMQLKPNDSNWNEEKKNIQEIGFISLNKDIESEQTLSLFRDEMQIGDVVLIRKGSSPIALVMVDSDAFYEKSSFEISLNCFEWRRKIKFLTWCKSSELFSIASIGTLRRSVDKETITYRYIDDTYKEFVGFYETEEKLFLKALKIKNYKRFNNFKIEFTKKDLSQKIIVLAGINGSGKTSLLEIINKIFYEPQTLNNYGISIKLEDKTNSSIEINPSHKNWQEILKGYKNHVIYIKAGIDDITNTNYLISQYINNKINNEDKRLSEANNLLKQLITDALSDLEVSFQFYSLKDGKILFSNNEGKIIEFESLSTGERTLVTKLVILHLQVSNLTGKIVLIDEPEISLHPTWQSKILKLYQTVAERCKCQIIIATHSPHIISSTPSECLRILKEESGKIFCYTSEYGYGQDFNSILLFIMGVEYTRDPQTIYKLKKLSTLLLDKGANSSEYKNLYTELRKQLGDYDTDLNLIALQARI